MLNNQALALAGVGRHEQAVTLYEEAIKAQRHCYQQSPTSQLMQEILSKMVYNQGRSLAALQRWDDATDSALTRREIWQDNAKRLFGVAVELAGIGSAAAQSDDTDSQHRIDRETISTLRQAFDRGYPRGIDLQTDNRFTHLQQNQEFADLLRSR